MSLLDRFDDEARSVLNAAQDEARALGHGYIGTEHLLIALLASGQTPALREAQRQGATADRARQRADDVFRATEGANGYVSNEDALAAVGVDAREVRRRAEAQFGPGAITMRLGNPPFTPRVRAVLQTALDRGRQADAVTVDHMLLGVVDDRDSVAAAFLHEVCSDVPGIVALV